MDRQADGWTDRLALRYGSVKKRENDNYRNKKNHKF